MVKEGSTPPPSAPTDDATPDHSSQPAYHSNSNGYIEDDIDDDEAKPLDLKKNLLNGIAKKEDVILSSKLNKDSLQNGISPSDAEFVFIQETGFTIKISPPGLEPFDVQVSSMELVQEIHQLLMDREETCHRTCFSLQMDGVTLDNFAELKSIEGLKDGSILKVVEEPYTVREARIHLRHVRDLLKCLDPADAYNAVDCSSLSFLNIITGGDILEKKKSRPESVDCTPPDCILPGSKDLLLSYLQPQVKDAKPPQALRSLTASSWNPPPGNRKLHGDLMYLYIVTLEDKKFHVTASTRGFYVNLSTNNEFNPKAAPPKHVYHSLVDLLNQISPLFKRNFAAIQKKRTQRHPFERVSTPYQVHCWNAPNFEHTLDSIRAEDAFSSKLGYEEHIPGQTRDWNEELQTTRELPRGSLPERLVRERAIFKVHSDLVAAATRGATAVVDGNVMAINPGEDARMHMFIWNSLFFSLGFDVRDHYQSLGGDAAAFTAPINDLQGVKAYNALDLEGVYTLGTVVIDYRGYRVTAQSIIPGILEKEQEQSVVYGSVDFGKTVVASPKYLELLEKAADQLKILPHRVINEKDEEVELYSSVECKGIVGNDGRHYILDLLRTFPPDVNYLITDDEPSEVAKSMGYPVAHKHKLCVLRQELVDAFVEHRYMTFIKLAAFHFQQLGFKKFLINKEDNKAEGDAEVECNNEIKGDENKNTCDKEDENLPPAEEYKSMMESIESKDNIDVAATKEVIKQACKAVKSLKETEFEIKFNPDVYSPGVTHAVSDTDPERLKKEKEMVRDAADFLLTQQIPRFVKDCLEHTSSPVDGITLTEALHTRGINIRYLGKVADQLKDKPTLDYVHTLAVMEMISRAAKHIFTSYLQGIELTFLSAAISHFLNCLLSSCQNLPAFTPAEELQIKTYKKKGKRKNKLGSFPFNGVQDNNEWMSLTPRSLWSSLRTELQSYYLWQGLEEGAGVDKVVEQYSIQKISLLRSFCIKNGIQILLRDYSFDHRSRPTFTDDDILNVFPVVKHVNPRASDAYTFYSTGQAKIQQGFLKEGYELIAEALNLLNNVYGAMHPEIAQCLRMLARLNYILGDHAEAMAYQQKAVLMSERVNGIDHPYTITEYTHLALYCFANSQVSTALKLLYRARYLTLLVSGENHPELAILDSNIGLILHAVGEYQLSLRFLENALQLNIKFFGARHIKSAVSHHLVARSQSCLGDFRAALSHERETYSIYRDTLGEAHEKTRESAECMRHLTTQAVTLQRRINEMTRQSSTGNTVALLPPPIQIQPPSLNSVLDMLNIINGILFVHISQQDLENFKLEFERRQQKEEQQPDGSATSPCPDSPASR